MFVIPTDISNNIMSKFYEDDSIEEGHKRNVAFQTTNAIREAVSLALKKPQPITYENAFNYIHDLDPGIYTKVVELLSNKNENDKVKYYKDMVEYYKGLGEESDAIDLITKDIDTLNEKISKSKKTPKGFKLELAKLLAAREYFKPRKVTEHRVLNSDVYVAEHPYFKKTIYSKDNYKDYEIGTNQTLRMRLIHPDKEEAILGADLIYEQFDLLREKVRFVHLQYKVWDSKRLYLSDPRLQAQVTKMNKHLCGNGFCLGKHHKNYSKKFRMPYCSGFLRPTNNKVNADSKLVSSGYHVPICEIMRMSQKDNKITKTSIKSKAVSHSIFEESFADNQLGSRWFTFNELEAFYQQVGLANLGDAVRIHAQEIISPTAEERDEYLKRGVD